MPQDGSERCVLPAKKTYLFPPRSIQKQARGEWAGTKGTAGNLHQARHQVAHGPQHTLHQEGRRSATQAPLGERLQRKRRATPARRVPLWVTRQQGRMPPVQGRMGGAGTGSKSKSLAQKTSVSDGTVCVGMQARRAHRRKEKRANPIVSLSARAPRDTRSSKMGVARSSRNPVPRTKKTQSPDRTCRARGSSDSPGGLWWSCSTSPCTASPRPQQQASTRPCTCQPACAQRKLAGKGSR